MKSFKIENEREALEKIIREVLIPYLVKVLGVVPKDLYDEIVRHSRIIVGIKDQYIEAPGTYEEGRLLIFESGIAHASFIDSDNSISITSHIFTKHDVFLDVNSFVNGTDRNRYIQMLDDGIIFSISFLRLKSLLANYTMLNLLLWPFLAHREEQYYQHQRLLKLRVTDRVKSFLDRKPGIASRADNSVLASYLGTCRSEFSSAYTKCCNEKGKL